MNKAKWKIWWNENWLKWLIILAVVAVIVFLPYGLFIFFFRMESFQRDTLMGSIPAHAMVGIFYSASFVFMYWLAFHGGFAKCNCE